MKPQLVIKDLHVSVDDKEIIKGLDLTINGGEVHAIMGPNGAGKSTLSNTIMGHPKYVVTKGSITFNGEDVLEMSVDERSRKGLFLAMQYPAEVSGVTNSDFIRTALNKRSEKPTSFVQFFRTYEKAVSDLKMRQDLPHRYLNEGFSGGEKKRNEILQMKVLKPRIALLDEIDSGLDVDALRIVGENVNEMVNEDFACLLITHYQRLLEYIKTDFVHIMINGKIVKTGDMELIKKIDESGYEWVRHELGIEIDEEFNQPISIGICNVNESTKI